MSVCLIRNGSNPVWLILKFRAVIIAVDLYNQKQTQTGKQEESQFPPGCVNNNNNNNNNNSNKSNHHHHHPWGCRQHRFHDSTIQQQANQPFGMSKNHQHQQSIVTFCQCHARSISLLCKTTACIYPSIYLSTSDNRFRVKRPLVAEASSALKEGRESERKEKDKTKAEEKKKKYVESEF
ncbi:hypothetical protein T4B_13232 [Trichinella pseudospiralis]|uniref:Uncharacterized protein n=1 Tax=Trichinella pseudospiralis TaxID=6337 RepID=A0A0V1JBA8_TRIPS|nr:hypothetical protein T4B_13232 [Trichinella pseudospiralis]